MLMQPIADLEKKEIIEDYDIDIPSCLEHYSTKICLNCGKIHRTPHTCNLTWCKKCYKQRYNRALARLMEYDIPSDKMGHMIIGAKKVCYKNIKSMRERNKLLRDCVNKALRRFRKETGFEFNALGIPDLADDGSYAHFHYGFLIEDGMLNSRRMNLDVQLLRKLLLKYSDGEIGFVKVMPQPRMKRSLFKYFAQRIAGKYGHGKKSFFLSDVFSLYIFKQSYFNVRKITIIGRKGAIVKKSDILSCNSAQTKFNCNVCGSNWFEKFENLPMPFNIAQEEELIGGKIIKINTLSTKTKERVSYFVKKTYDKWVKRKFLPEQPENIGHDEGLLSQKFMENFEEGYLEVWKQRGYEGGRVQYL